MADIAFLLDGAFCLPVAFPDLLMRGLKRLEVRATQRLGQPVQGMLGQGRASGARLVPRRAGLLLGKLCRCARPLGRRRCCNIGFFP